MLSQLLGMCRRRRMSRDWTYCCKEPMQPVMMVPLLSRVASVRFSLNSQSNRAKNIHIRPRCALFKCQMPACLPTHRSLLYVDVRGRRRYDLRPGYMFTLSFPFSSRSRPLTFVGYFRLRSGSGDSCGQKRFQSRISVCRRAARGRCK